MIEASKRKAKELHVMETEWEVKYCPKNFHDVLERGNDEGGGLGVETKRHMTFFREQIELRVVPKIYMKKYMKSIDHLPCLHFSGRNMNWKYAFECYFLTFL